MSIKSYRQTGVGLVEVLVSMLIVSVGALSLISMQIAGKRIGYDALQRSVATTLVHDILERMRNNPLALTGYTVNNLGGETISSEPSPNCTSAVCTPTQLAARDLWEWEQNLDGAAEMLDDGSGAQKVGGLVDPRACITHSAGVVTITIVWKGYQSMSNPAGSNCGEGLGLYGSGESQRQMVSVTTFIEEI